MISVLRHHKGIDSDCLNVAKAGSPILSLRFFIGQIYTAEFDIDHWNRFR